MTVVQVKEQPFCEGGKGRFRDGPAAGTFDGGGTSAKPSDAA
jgi:hypothetical protein